MKASVDYGNALENMQGDIQKLLENADANINPTLRKIGSVIATEATRHAPEHQSQYLAHMPDGSVRWVKSNPDYYWSKGQKKPNTHIAKDVTYKIGKARKTKSKFVSVSGGSKTWPKWILANDGHVASNGRFIAGSHFVEKTEKASEKYVDHIVDEFLKGIVNG